MWKHTIALVALETIIVTAMVRLSLRTSRTPKQQKHYDWSSLKDKELQEIYTITVRNRFEELHDKSDRITEDDKFVQSNMEAAEIHSQ